MADGPALESLHRLWGDEGADRVKKVMAAHLLTTADPDPILGLGSTTTSRAAAVVRQALGPDWQQQYGQPGCKLWQLLQQDPCFLVQELVHGEKAIRLQLSHLQWRLSAAAAAQATVCVPAAAACKSAATAARTEPVQAAAIPPAATSSSSTGQLVAAAALDHIWGNAGADCLKKVMAAHLLSNSDPDLGSGSTTTTRTSQHVRKMLGPGWQQQYKCSGRKLWQILQEDPCFLVEESVQGEKAIKLQLPQLQQRLAPQAALAAARTAAAAQPPPPLLRPAPAAAAVRQPPPPAAPCFAMNATTASSRSAEQLLAAVQRRWGSSSTAEYQVRAALATCLVTAAEPRLPPHSMTFATAGQAVIRALGSNWRQQLGLGRAVTLQQLVEGDVCFLVEGVSWTKSQHAVRLDAARLLQLHGCSQPSTSCAAQPFAAAPCLSVVPARPPKSASADPCHSSNSTTAAVTSSSSYSTEQLLAAVQGQWGSSSTAVDQVKAALATCLVTAAEPRLPPHSMTFAAAGLAMRKTLGSNWRQKLGLTDKLQRLVEGDGYLLTEGVSWTKDHLAVRLDATGLVQVYGISQSSSSCAAGALPAAAAVPPACPPHPELVAANNNQLLADRCNSSTTTTNLAARGSSTRTEQLLAAVQRRWGSSSSAEDQVRAALATCLATAADPRLPPHSMTFATAGEAVIRALGSNWRQQLGLGPTVKLQQLVQEDVCFLVEGVSWTKSQHAVLLDVARLLQLHGSRLSSSTAAPAEGPELPPPITLAAAGQRQRCAGCISSSTAAANATTTRCPAWYQQLLQVGASSCSSTPVVLIDLMQPAAVWEPQLGDCLAHLNTCSVLAVDCEHAALMPADEAAGSGSSSNDKAVSSQVAGHRSQGGDMSGSSKSNPADTQLAMLQVYAPSTGRTDTSSSGSSSLRAAIYLIALPTDQMVTEQVLQQLLQPVLSSLGVVKVMHDPRQDAAVLQQYGVVLQGVLDTQLLAGLLAAAEAADAAEAAGELDGSGRPTAAAAASLRRIGLGALYRQFGFDHPEKKAVHKQFNQDHQLWFRRPFAQQLLDYAAGDVRYLLPVAAAQLQQLPSIAAAFSSSVLAGLTQQNGLQLQKQQVSGYSGLFGLGSDSKHGDGSAAVNVQFELVLDEQLRPSYKLHLLEEAEEPGLDSAAAAASSGQLVGDAGNVDAGNANGATASGSGGSTATGSDSSGGDSDGSTTCSSTSGDSTAGGSGGGGGQDSPEAGGIDEAVMSLLPSIHPRLEPALLPYIFSPEEPALQELALDAGRPVVLQLSDGTTVKLPEQYQVSIEEALTVLQRAVAGNVGAVGSELQQDSRSSASTGDGAASDPTDQQRSSSSSTMRLFGSDNRLAVAGSLHRISAMFTNRGAISGLTYRVGRHVPGVGRLLLDVLASLKRSLIPGSCPESLLLLGRPGVGKTTLLRDVARLLSTPVAEGGLGLRVVVVDTSNEIAGDGPTPHSCIGDARRMMVRSREDQARVLLEAVQNHNPQVIIMDEIGTKEEVAAARTISQRGVVLVGTAHGISLGSLMRNPDLRPLVGGVTAVTLGDAAAQQNGNKKTRLERAGSATFTRLVEVLERNRWRYHPSVECSVDTMLRSATEVSSTAAGDVQLSSSLGSCSNGLLTQLRSMSPSGQLLVQFETAAAAAAALAAAGQDSIDGNTAATGGKICGGAPGSFPGAWLVNAGHVALHQLLPRG